MVVIATVETISDCDVIEEEEEEVKVDEEEVSIVVVILVLASSTIDFPNTASIAAADLNICVEL